MVDEVIVLTLADSFERHWAWLGASQVRKIPYENISYIKGHAGRDFENMEEVAAFAAADGFDFVEEYAIGTVTEYVHQTPASVSQVWNFARILRYISDSTLHCLVLTDDKMLTISFNKLCMLVDELRTCRGKEFFLFQLMRRGDLNELEFVEKDRFEAALFSYDVFDLAFNKEVSGYSDFFLQEGIIGYDESMVLSPAGAAWLLGCLQSSEDFHIFYDHFICKGLPKQSKIAGANGKGIYTPAEVGYSFAEQIMPMGTGTHWAPKGTFHYEESLRTTAVPWKEID